MSAAVFRLVFGGPIMSSDPVGPRSAEVFRTFVSELATCRQGPEVVDRLRQGHQPDQHGWCSHPAHAHRWERYPCVVVRLATLVEDVDGRARFEHSDEEAANPSREAGRGGAMHRGAGGETRGPGGPRTRVGRSGV